MATRMERRFLSGLIVGMSATFIPGCNDSALAGLGLPDLAAPTPQVDAATNPVPDLGMEGDLPTSDATPMAEDLANSNCGPLSIAKRTTVPNYGGNATNPLVTDFNRDGNLDVALDNGGVVTVLLGDGDGGFSRFENSPCTFHGDLAGDFNGDGHPDIAGFYQPMAMFGVLLNRGDGTFAPSIDTQIQEGARQLVQADFDRDGKLDLALDAYEWNAPRYATVYFGNGDGTFGRSETLIPGMAASPLLVGDFDNDGSADLVVHLDCACPLWDHAGVLLNNGKGVFAQAPDSAPSIGMLASADFNVDGKLDVFTQEWVYLGRGDGTFRAGLPVSRSVYVVGNPVVGDFNHDGKLDVAETGTAGFGIFLYMGRGDGTFDGPMNCSAGQTFWDLAAGDFNNDGKIDLIADDDGGVVTVFVQK